MSFEFGSCFLTLFSVYCLFYYHLAEEKELIALLYNQASSRFMNSKGGIVVIQILTIRRRVIGILILIGSLGCLKDAQTMDMLLEQCKFPKSFLPYCQYHMLEVHIGIASMRQFQSVPIT